MNNLRFLTLALLITSLAIAPAFAKRHGCDNQFNHDGKRTGQIEQLKQALDLTPQQEVDIQEIRSASREQTASLREATQANREAIRESFGADTLDETRLRELIRAQAELRTDMMIAKHATRSKINQTLTPAQQSKHKEFRQQRMEQRGPHRGAGPKAGNM